MGDRKDLRTASKLGVECRHERLQPTAFGTHAVTDQLHLLCRADADVRSSVTVRLLLQGRMPNRGERIAWRSTHKASQSVGAHRALRNNNNTCCTDIANNARLSCMPPCMLPPTQMTDLKKGGSAGIPREHHDLQLCGRACWRGNGQACPLHGASATACYSHMAFTHALLPGVHAGPLGLDHALLHKHRSGSAIFAGQLSVPAHPYSSS